MTDNYLPAFKSDTLGGGGSLESSPSELSIRTANSGAISGEKPPQPSSSQRGYVGASQIPAGDVQSFEAALSQVHEAGEAPLPITQNLAASNTDKPALDTPAMPLPASLAASNTDKPALDTPAMPLPVTPEAGANPQADSLAFSMSNPLAGAKKDLSSEDREGALLVDTVRADEVPLIVHSELSSPATGASVMHQSSLPATTLGEMSTQLNQPPAETSSKDYAAVAQIVKDVTRTLAHRDLEALSMGRKVVLYLDESLLPKTSITFQPVPAVSARAGDLQTQQVLVGLHTESADVQTFFSSHGHDLVTAMAKEAPGLRWELASEVLMNTGPQKPLESSMASGLSDGDSSHSQESGTQQDQSSQQDQPKDGSQSYTAISDDPDDGPVIAKWRETPEGSRDALRSDFDSAVEG